MKGSQSPKQKQKQTKKKVEKVPKVAQPKVVFSNARSTLPFAFIPVLLFFIFAVLVLINNDIIASIQKNTLLPINTKTTIHPYPFIQAVQLPDVSAKSAIIIDADSQVVIFSKNPRVRFSMASTTKIMTALVALGYFRKDSILTVQTLYEEGSRLGLYPGERFYREDLLYAMLLPSANDAAYAVAENYPGGIEAFVGQMNKKAQSLYLHDTHFADPTGLDDDGNFTTVMDLARLASAAMQHDDFSRITGTKTKTIHTVDNTREFELNNLNKLLGMYGVNGIKTGTTEAAGEVLVTSTVADGHTFIIVVMNSKQRFDDTKKLLLFVADNVQYIAPDLPSAGYSGEVKR